MKLYLDSVVLIYSVESVPGFGAKVDARLSQPGVELVTSELARMECRIKPLREGNRLLLAMFEEQFNEALDSVVPISRQVLDRAAELRAHFGFKTPDAIHLAAALLASCDVFYTNDHRLDRCTSMAIEVVEP